MSPDPPRGSSVPEADKMNDPAYDTNASRQHANAANSEPDHCRICRSEGTTHEPLYHPCKCSGSIKFVHQDCLMEWLAHSQKKYCELCKTPFTFTKVYDPDMPNSLPTPLFVRQLTRRLARGALRFLRGLLVAFVWLGCLPWCVRWMWRGWFWVSDGGWWQLQANGFPGTPVPETPTDTQQPSTSTSAAGYFAFLSPPALLAAVSPATGGANSTATNLDVVATAFNMSAVNTAYSDGLFFERNPLFNATRFEFVNNLIVDVLEGQLLTALIVVTFIIVFLIREWVVQQQPALLGDAANIPLLNEQIDVGLPADDPAGIEAFAAPAQAPAAVEPDIPVVGAAVPADDDEEDEWVERAFGVERDTAGGEEEGAPRDEADVLQQRVIAQPRKRRRVAPTDTEPGSSSSQEATGENPVEESGAIPAFNFADLPLRPTPTRANTSQVAGLRRELEETTRSGSTSAQYDFGGTGGSTDNRFQFGGANPEPSRPPDIWAQTTPSGGDISERLETIDTGRSANWMREHASSAPVSPTPSEQRTSEFGIALGSHDNDVNDGSGSASWASSSSFEIIGAPTNKGKGVEVELPDQIPAVKGKGKENSPVDAQLDGENDSVEEYGDDDEMRTEGSLGVGTSEWSMAAHAGDALSESSATPPVMMPPAPPPMPTHLDPLNVHLRNQQLEDAQRLEELRNGVQAQARHLQELQNEMAEWERVAPPAGAVAPQEPPQPQQARRAGLLGWIIGDDGAQDQMEIGADEDDTDDEDAPVGAAAAVPQGILDDEAADDFEGIMELVGMRGPLIGLVQNAAISSMLITATVAVGVAFPYVTGKTVMMVLAHPVLFFFRLPMMAISFCAEFLVDFSTMVAFSLLLMCEQAIRSFLKPATSILPGLSGYLNSGGLTTFLRNWASDGQARVVAKFVSIETTYMTVRKFPPSAVPPLSLVVKESFERLMETITWGLGKVGLAGLAATEISAGPEHLDLNGLKIANPLAWAVHAWEDTFATINFTHPLNATAETIGYSSNPQEALTYAGLYKWSTWDRVGVVMLGYAFFTIAGMTYVKRRRQQPPGHVEKLAAEFLQQCGGVMKVVLIIGIEMFVFPLYCGVLLDMAMLPLFETATIASRIQFAIDFPFTNVFVHWFVGTCYMFHFALFVSMCRKIMRTGVLYFIRDPDDPNFHPVRDVLNRPIVTQLRKIGFSAFIYGVLVLMCLGGVVWGLHGVTSDVLPIHWSSNEPVFEFPVDLLFYNFLMPLAVKFFKPSDGLQNMYAWWFQKCARALRLSSFMFGERNADEEGYTVYPTWRSFFMREKPDYDTPIMPDMEPPANQIYFRRSGRFVRAPASDSIRRPKGTSVFIPVDEQNRRLDVNADLDPPNGPTSANSTDWRLAYIPPFFRARIGIVVVGIWFFAAVTGVSFTIGPLLVGRLILRQLVPSQVRLNDIYAFSVGVYVLGGATLCLSKLPAAYNSIKVVLQPLTSAASNASYPEKINNLRIAVTDVVIRSLKICYVVTAFAIVIPTLVALIIEFYFIIPLHTAFGVTASASATPTFPDALENINSTVVSAITAAAPPNSRFHLEHTIHFVQDWTLGVLYVKMMCKMVLLDDNSVWARSLRGIVAHGWLNPDAKLATRVFIAPCILAMIAALGFPVAMAKVLVILGIADGAAIYRFAFPAFFLAMCISAAGYALYRVVEGWKEGVRDEVYLRGMRIHNHGEETSMVRGRVGDIVR